jgi:hypothetical protein
VYDARGGGRSAILDGPWWLGGLGVLVATVLTFGSDPWKWLVGLVAALFLWLPAGLRWGSAIHRSVRAFREGLRS